MLGAGRGGAGPGDLVVIPPTAQSPQVIPRSGSSRVSGAAWKDAGAPGGSSGHWRAGEREQLRGGGRPVTPAPAADRGSCEEGEGWGSACSPGGRD